MKEIKLLGGKVTIVDDEDFEYLNKHKWHSISNHGYQWYAVRNIQKGKGRTTEYMHRRILKTPKGMITDHLNGDGLYNLRNNLRVCSYSVNHQNLHTRNGKSLYQGVFKRSEKGRWQARIQLNKKEIALGTFSSERMAAVAYNIAALRYYGIDAKINDIKS